MLTEVRIHFDGAANNHLDFPNLGLGIAIFINNEYQEDLSRAIHIAAESSEKKLTSNDAEWYACIEAMKIASKLQINADRYRLIVLSDSQVITNQFNGDYFINKPEFKERRETALHYARKVGIRDIRWIPREENTKADELSKIGLYGEEGYLLKKKTSRKKKHVVIE